MTILFHLFISLRQVMLLSHRLQFSLSMLAFFISLSALIYFMLAPARAMVKWDTIQGEIVESRLLALATPQNPDQIRWDAKIVYQYAVDGKVYHQERVFAVSSDFSHDKIHAQALVNRYKQGQAVPVFYNPEQPYDAVLIKGGDDNMTAARVMLAALTILFGMKLFYRLGAYFHFKKWHRVRFGM